MNYAYDGPEMLVARKPYGFAPFEGSGFLSDFAEARAELAQRLSRRSEPNDAWRRGWADRPRAGRVLSATPGPLTETEDFLESLLASAVRDARAFSNAETRPLQSLLGRMEAFGRVFARYDENLRRDSEDANAPGILIRLAAAAAWWATHDPVPARRLATTNVLLKLLDRCAAGVRYGGWELSSEDAAWLSGAVELERRLIERWEAEAQ